MNPEEWRLTAFRRFRFRCAVTEEPVGFCSGEVHHVIGKGLLRARGLYHLVWHPDNALLVKREIHAAHEFQGGEGRIPREKLPQSALKFAAALGGWGENEIERKYPQ